MRELEEGFYMPNEILKLDNIIMIKKVWYSNNVFLDVMHLLSFYIAHLHIYKSTIPIEVWILIGWMGWPKLFSFNIKYKKRNEYILKI